MRWSIDFLPNGMPISSVAHPPDVPPWTSQRAAFPLEDDHATAAASMIRGGQQIFRRQEKSIVGRVQSFRATLGPHFMSRRWSRPVGLHLAKLSTAA